MRMPSELAEHADVLARALLGDPDHESAGELRWGTNGSFKVTTEGAKAGLYYDNEAGTGGNLLGLIQERLECDEVEAIAWVKQQGVDIRSKHPVAAYLYRALDGAVLFRVLRWAPKKTFTQESFDAATGRFTKGLNGADPVPYRLNDWHDRDGPILIPEGEKHVDLLVSLGFTATCNPMGAGKWRACYSEYFRAADIVILPDNDRPGRAHARQVAEALLPVAASVRVLELGGLPEKGDIIDWLDNGGTPERLCKLIATAPDAQTWLAANPTETKAKQEPDATGPYFVRDGGIWRTVQTREGPTAVPLTNFTAVIAGEVVRDDGVETLRQLEIEAQVQGRAMTFTVPAAEYAGMAWTARELGGRAHVFPGQGTKDHARFAIQVLSPDYTERRVFAHTGWRRIDGRPVYLHGGGAISANGLRADVETELGNELERFTLPAPGDPKASLQLLDLASLDITATVLALTYRAPLGPSDITEHLAGPTGVFKSELAALAQQHFAPGMDARHLVGWHSTGNSLEAMAFASQDSLLVIDDYAPGGTASDVQRLQREAARLIRAQGNRAGRSRLRPDGTLRPTKPPRCTILSTGEDIPGGQSIRARMCVVEVAAGDIDQMKLSAAQPQAMAGAFAGAMAAYIAWLATDLDGHQERFRRRRDALRQQVQAGHRRTAWMVGELGAALEMYLAFAGALDRWDACWKALLRAAAAQDQHQADEDPARRFIALIGALLSSRQAHLGRADEPDLPPDKAIAGRIGWQADPPAPGYPPTWRAQGPRIGWVSPCGTIAYLDPETAYSTAQRLASSQGSAIAVTARTLWKRLAAAGLLALRDADQNTVKVQIGDERKRVIATALSYAPQSGQSGRAGQEAPEAAGTADARPENPPCFPADPELSGREIRAEPKANSGFQEAPPCSPCSPCFSGHNTEPVQKTAPNGPDPDPAPVPPRRRRDKLVERKASR
jgi:hypothetical protein